MEIENGEGEPILDALVTLDIPPGTVTIGKDGQRLPVGVNTMTLSEAIEQGYVTMETRPV